jgi:hypothetical protein
LTVPGISGSEVDFLDRYLPFHVDIYSGRRGYCPKSAGERARLMPNFQDAQPPAAAAFNGDSAYRAEEEKFPGIA